MSSSQIDGTYPQHLIDSGWCFGTWILFFHILGTKTPTDEHIFQRGRYTTNQDLSYPMGRGTAVEHEHHHGGLEYPSWHWRDDMQHPSSIVNTLLLRSDVAQALGVFVQMSWFSPNNNTPKTWWKVVVLNVGKSQESRPWWPWQPIDINRWTIYI